MLAEHPQYILIQFGHNDSHAKGQPESTDADTTYADNLRGFVREAREAGSTAFTLNETDHADRPGRGDRTHFTGYGARRMASLVAEGLARVEPDLARRISTRATD